MRDGQRRWPKRLLQTAAALWLLPLVQAGATVAAGAVAEAGVCTDHARGVQAATGQVVALQGECARLLCDEGIGQPKFITQRCERSPSSNCTVQNGDLNALYPDCCPRIMCGGHLVRHELCLRFVPGKRGSEGEAGQQQAVVVVAKGAERRLGDGQCGVLQCTGFRWGRTSTRPAWRFHKKRCGKIGTLKPGCSVVSGIEHMDFPHCCPRIVCTQRMYQGRRGQAEKQARVLTPSSLTTPLPILTTSPIPIHNLDRNLSLNQDANESISKTLQETTPKNQTRILTSNITSSLESSQTSSLPTIQALNQTINLTPVQIVQETQNQTRNLTSNTTSNLTSSLYENQTQIQNQSFLVPEKRLHPNHELHNTSVHQFDPNSLAQLLVRLLEHNQSKPFQRQLDSRHLSHLLRPNHSSSHPLQKQIQGLETPAQLQERRAALESLQTFQNAPHLQRKALRTLISDSSGDSSSSSCGTSEESDES